MSERGDLKPTFSLFFILCYFMLKAFAYQYFIKVASTKKNKAKIRKTKILRNKNGTK